MLWRVLHMVVIYAVLYILIYLIERYLKKDIEELQITRRELLVVYFVMIMVYCISNVSYVDVKSISVREQLWMCLLSAHCRSQRYGSSLCLSHSGKRNPDAF